MWLQKKIQLAAKPRGFHLITDEVFSALPELASVKTGIVHLFLQHTSASLSINENADDSVRRDMESHFNQLAPENAEYYEHVYEGADDMPAHIKSGLLGVEITLPISNGSFQLGIWQGIYLGEHRNHGGPRIILASMQGE
ncbi:MAG: YjbQ family protein [Gammaproteobacteria bacterium]|jgi:secondary thiamine-phosphate synthase enzyme|nr:YjbQ family protein [Gammaproteobacteria bacterium]MBT3859729.1 YjbQ family protein [Gammaproteobacteria bacterium]MBT3987250.1 YjbQ family protein [Gammaproteobacteria bacterium]MBT4582254.1 YjbQ family protein [Gammaproteobacteria bacterium]MBT4659472.1 YjbQ family protein [Gammaproteobacteria bacterium]